MVKHLWTGERSSIWGRYEEETFKRGSWTPRLLKRLLTTLDLRRLEKYSDVCFFVVGRIFFFYLLRGLRRSFDSMARHLFPSSLDISNLDHSAWVQHFHISVDNICMRPIFTQVSFVPWPGSSYLTFGGNYWELITNMQNIGIYVWTRDDLMTSITDRKHWVIYTKYLIGNSPLLPEIIALTDVWYCS